jgi:hypothetical protein
MEEKFDHEMIRIGAFTQIIKNMNPGQELLIKLLNGETVVGSKDLFDEDTGILMMLIGFNVPTGLQRADGSPEFKIIPARAYIHTSMILMIGKPQAITEGKTNKN